MAMDGLPFGDDAALASGGGSGKAGVHPSGARVCYASAMSWKRRLEPIARPVFRVISRITRGMTLGVRALVLNEAGEVLLIKHTYVSGWYMPGGGVERGETTEQALVRELVEEAGIRATERPRLVSMHSNHVRFAGDHVLIYRVDAWEPCAA